MASARSLFKFDPGTGAYQVDVESQDQKAIGDREYSKFRLFMRIHELIYVVYF